MLYEKLDTDGNENSLVAIDSIDSLGEKYGISPRRLLMMLQKDLVERSGVNVVFILEAKDSNSMEYLGDGVISLEMGELDGRRMRRMKVEKLRGQEIISPNILFTLNRGHFTCFEEKAENIMPSIRPIETGKIMKNLIAPGTYTLFEVSRNVPGNIIKNLVDSISKLLGTRGIYSTPSIRLFGGNLASQSNIKLISPVAMIPRGLESGNIIRVDGDEFFADFDDDMVGRHLNSENRAFFLDANQIISHYGKDSINDLEVHISMLLRRGGTCIGFVWPESNSQNMDMGISSNLIKIKSIDSQLIFYGLKPYSPLYLLAQEKDEMKFEIMV